MDTVPSRHWEWNTQAKRGTAYGHCALASPKKKMATVLLLPQKRSGTTEVAQTMWHSFDLGLEMETRLR